VHWYERCFIVGDSSLFQFPTDTMDMLKYETGFTPVDSQGFRRWPMVLRITEVFGICPLWSILENTKEHNCSETGSPVLCVCSLEYRTMDKVLKPSSPEGIDTVILCDVILLRKIHRFLKLCFFL
jgi:hypothetical protein